MKEKKCKYCIDSSNFENEPIAEIPYTLGIIETSLLVGVYELCQSLGISLGDIVAEDIKINYCPMCGRKLVK